MKLKVRLSGVIENPDGSRRKVFLIEGVDVPLRLELVEPETTQLEGVVRRIRRGEIPIPTPPRREKTEEEVEV
jgi:hypothetical protein